MTTDKELLELAAKAAGINGHSGTYFGEPVFMRDGHTPWNPLTDDGDALRLAVKLHIDIQFEAPDIRPHWKTITRTRRGNYATEENNDPYAATRRAIVRAAAEIGRKL